MSEILADLNPRQLEAVTAPPGPLLVLAGPGSGKTHVIARRAAWLVADRSILPHEILCVTFTNRAAQEMQARLETLLDEAGRGIRVYTFHALCTRILRHSGAAIGLDPYFVVADEGLQTELMIQAVRQMDLSLESFPAHRLLDFISQYKRNLQDPAQAGPDEVPAEVTALAGRYQALLAARGLLDFDDLIGQSVRLLAMERATRLSLQRSLAHILVDEYQDINRAQFELLKLLAPPGHDVLAVADPAQSIYGWRGAQPGLIETFQQHYRPAVIELEQSYRSTPTILFAAEHLIRHNRPTRPASPAPRTAAEPGTQPGAPIYHYLFSNSRQEQHWLAALINRLVGERGYHFGDIAILYRTHQLADELEAALLQSGIPLERIRRESFYQEPAVREIIRYLHLMRSLGSDDLLAAFNFPETLADELTVLQLRQLAGSHDLTLAELAQRAADFPELGPLTRTDLQSFIRLFEERLRPATEAGATAAVTALLDALMARSSPFSFAEYRLLREAAAFLSYQEAAEALRDHLALHGQAHLTTPATVDGTCAAVILEQTIDRYLGSRLEISLSIDDAPGQQLEIELAGRPEPLIIRPPRGSLGYSLSTLAWRLAQELLVAHETAGTEPMVVYDLETTGTSVLRDEIVEIAAQRLENATPSGEAFYSLVRPRRGIPPAAMRVHGIHMEDTEGAGGIEAVLPRFLRYTGQRPVVGHNILRFDNRIIDRETGRLYGRGFPNPAVDTLEMARRLYQDDTETAVGLGLDSLMARLHLDRRSEHRAETHVAQTTALFRHLLRENALQRGLRALPEYLPLVAVGMAASGVSLTGENQAIWHGAARCLARGGQTAAFELVRRRLDGPGRQVFDETLAALPAGSTPPAEPRWAVWQEQFMAHLAVFLRTSEDHSLEAFLDHVALVTGADTAQRARLNDRVTLMTLHNAKGSEYPVVIIAGVEEENLPLWTTLGDEGQLSEERRVFYVGMTRAQRQLYLTSARQRGDGFVRVPSRFAWELPPEYMRRLQIGPAGEMSEIGEPKQPRPEES